MMYDYFYGKEGEQYAFYRIPKALFTMDCFANMTTDAKILYGLLLDRVSLSVENSWMDADGKVYIIFTLEEVMKALNCADKKATKLLRELYEYGLLERKRQGMGKPSIIYVKNFYSDSLKERFKNRKNDDSRVVQTTIHDSSKVRGINTDINNTDFNKTNLILSEKEDEMRNRTLFHEMIKQNIEYDILLRDYPYETESLDEIVDLIVDVICSNQRETRIGGDDKPIEVVRGQYEKLNYSHIKYVLDSLKENTTEIKNIRQYLLTALYNATMTINAYYSAQYRHDRAMGNI